MNFNELEERYRTLQAVNKQLKARIRQLENQTGKKTATENEKVEQVIENQPETNYLDIAPVKIVSKAINKHSPPAKKVNLFMSLFKSREDVFATRWENSKKGTSGYSPACGNEWVPGICRKPKVKC